MIRRFNNACHRFEYGLWFIGKYGKPMWRHLEWASEVEWFYV